MDAPQVARPETFPLIRRRIVCPPDRVCGEVGCPHGTPGFRGRSPRPLAARVAAPRSGHRGHRDPDGPAGRAPERSLVEYHLQEFEFSTLQALAAHQGRAVPTELVADLRVSPATMTGRLDTLEHRGFVRRKQSSVDRRRVDVELTAAGYRAWRSGVDAVGVEEHRILESLPAADRQQLSDLLRRLLAAAEVPDRAGGK
jgi:DNA-binding MarR family transcriptional regulator